MNAEAERGCDLRTCGRGVRLVLAVLLGALPGCVTVYQPLQSLQRPVVVDPALPNLEWRKTEVLVRHLPELKKRVAELEQRIAELEEKLASWQTPTDR